ncbi:MAG: 50S ribosomal protein L10 [Pseudomonadota bacterium]
MNRSEKAELVEWIGEVFDKNAVVVLVANKGLSVTEMSGLRNELRGVDARMRVVKNRLAKIAIADREQAPLADMFEGPTAIVFAEDPVAPAKIVEKFAKDNDRLEILGGAMGPEIMDQKGVKALAAMPSREELIAEIATLIGSPASNIAGAIGAPAADIAGILKTIEERDAA